MKWWLIRCWSERKERMCGWTPHKPELEKLFPSQVLWPQSFLGSSLWFPVCLTWPLCFHYPSVAQATWLSALRSITLCKDTALLAVCFNLGCKAHQWLTNLVRGFVRAWCLNLTSMGLQENMYKHILHSWMRALQKNKNNKIYTSIS